MFRYNGGILVRIKQDKRFLENVIAPGRQIDRWFICKAKKNIWTSFNVHNFRVVLHLNYSLGNKYKRLRTA